MPEFKPGDQVKHQISKEEGVVKTTHLMRYGSNVLEVILVQAGNRETIWLPHEVDLIKGIA